MDWAVLGYLAVWTYFVLWPDHKKRRAEREQEDNKLRWRN